MKKSKVLITVAFVIVLALSCMGCTEESAEKTSESASNLISGIVNGFTDAVGKIDQESLTNAIDKTVTVVGTGVAKGTGNIIEAIDPDKAANDISKVISTITIGTYKGCDALLKKFQDADFNVGSLSTSQVKELKKEVTEAKEEVKSDETATKTEKEEKLDSLNKIQAFLNDKNKPSEETVEQKEESTSTQTASNDGEADQGEDSPSGFDDDSEEAE